MIADTTFVSDLHPEFERGQHGPARQFLARHRAEAFWITVISAGEIAIIFDTTADARQFLGKFKTIKHLGLEVAMVASQIDRELIETGGRLGEDDNWIAAFCRYYGQPIISRDTAFDRVDRLRRLPD
ncbi:MAG TPA: type II toxin-antitoxin system VapC family toxin [Verrucomicrobiota bacterium]|nr:type II toxin-antitoxin system VapC family toxin [Verrucomicrobiota bacterium]